MRSQNFSTNFFDFQPILHFYFSLNCRILPKQAEFTHGKRNAHHHLSKNRLLDIDRFPRVERASRKISHQSGYGPPHRRGSQALQLHSQPAGKRPDHPPYEHHRITYPECRQPLLCKYCQCGYPSSKIPRFHYNDRGHDGECKNEQQDVLSLISRKVDGIIIVPCDREPDFLEGIGRHNIPIVLIDRYFDTTTLPYVCTDNFRGGYEATKHLIEHGHKRIACIQGVPYSMPNKERVRGYREALREYGLEGYIRVSGEDFSVQNGYLETKLLLNEPAIPSAIFTLSNTILQGAIKAIRESGLRIPQDISIISFDNNTYLDYLDPAVTRISQPTDEIGTLAVKILMESISGEKAGTPKSRYRPN